MSPMSVGSRRVRFFNAGSAARAPTEVESVIAIVAITELRVGQNQLIRRK